MAGGGEHGVDVVAAASSEIVWGYIACSAFERVRLNEAIITSKAARRSI
jgi:hypothetical protein